MACHFSHLLRGRATNKSAAVRPVWKPSKVFFDMYGDTVMIAKTMDSIRKNNRKRPIFLSKPEEEVVAIFTIRPPSFTHCRLFVGL
jgi:hypothetical protein